MDVHGSRIAVMTGAPRPVEQLPPRPGPARVTGEDRQQVKLLGPEVDEMTVAPQLVRDEIQLAAIGHGQGPVGAGTSPLLEQGQPRGKLIWGDRAWQGVVEAESQRVEPRLDGFGRSKVDDAQAVAPPPFTRKELRFRRAAWRGRQQRDPRPAALKQGDERLDVGHHSDAAPGKRRQLERWPVGCECEPLERGRGSGRTLVHHGPRVGPRR